jgi:hypothetical protein
MRVVTVILHYGPCSRTAGLHDQLLRADPGARGDIFVLDNSSPQPFVPAWKTNNSNLYWAGALEQVMRFWSSHGASHVWFLNNDIFFVTPPPLIGRVKARLSRAEDLVGPVGVYSPAVTSNPYHPQMVERPGGQFRLVRYVDGIAPLISVEFWRRAGGVDFKGNPYGYGVDVWFSSQAENHGFSCVVDHQLVVRHSYHSAAGEVDGFLQKAAGAEAEYLIRRLGPHYRARMQEMAEDVREFG